MSFGRDEERAVRDLRRGVGSRGVGGVYVHLDGTCVSEGVGSGSALKSGHAESVSHSFCYIRVIIRTQEQDVRNGCTSYATPSSATNHGILPSNSPNSSSVVGCIFTFPSFPLPKSLIPHLSNVTGETSRNSKPCSSASFRTLLIERQLANLGGSLNGSGCGSIANVLV